MLRSPSTRMALTVLAAGVGAPAVLCAQEMTGGAGCIAFVSGVSYVKIPWLLFMLISGTAWIAAAVWVNQDAIGVGEAVERWNLIFVLTGVVLFLGAFHVGLKLLLLLLIVLGAEMGAYIWSRNQRVPANFRLLTTTHIRELLTKAMPAVGSKLKSRDTSAASKKDASEVVLTRKDGTTADALAADKRHSEVSESILASKLIMENAMKARATDIHLEPKGNELQVRYRVDGILHNQAPYDREVGQSIVSSLKVLSDMDIAERRRPQDGTFSAKLHDATYDIRSASAPTNYGEKMVMRLLESSGGVHQDGLVGIGCEESDLKVLRGIVHSPHGMMITSGPTGSGKTTTLYAALGEIDALQRNIITIEDPIEYKLDNVTQIPVNPVADLTFANIMRSILRQDPDVIMIGEMRDLETCQIGMQAALTGHFVFTTLHANDSITSITRLLDLGVDSTLIQSAVSAFLAQRLVRKLCEECKEGYTPKPEFLQRLNIPPDKVQRLYKEKGCEECQGTGYRGRTGIHELLVMTDAMRDLVTPQPSIQSLRKQARTEGLRTLQEDGLRKVIKGLTSITEVIRVSK